MLGRQIRELRGRLLMRERLEGVHSRFHFHVTRELLVD
jgi:hypothetical protein